MERITFTEFFGLALKELALKQKDRKPCWLVEDAGKFHPKLKELKAKHAETLEPLRKLHFATFGAFPYSSELARTMDLLQQSGSIKRENPDYNRFAPTVADDTKEFIGKLKNEIFKNDEKAKQEFCDFVDGLKELLTESEKNKNEP